MQQKNYIIKYTAQAKNGAVLGSGTMKAKRKSSSIEAQVKFEEFLKKKYPDFGKLIVHSCTEENPFSSILGDAFGSGTPFDF